jgi:fructose-1,6-bisphosphatase/sedoheptulose 1,7-bisphosphatase-like protein
MKTQEHNKGPLAELKVMIDKELVEAVAIMAKNSGMTPEDIVAVAIKRFRHGHADYMGQTPRID